MPGWPGCRGSEAPLLDREDLAKVKEEFPQATCFLWFHDAQVWNGVS